MTITSSLRFLYIFGGSGLLCGGDSGLHAARPPLTKHDPGFNFIDRKKSLAILDYVDLAYIDI